MKRPRAIYFLLIITSLSCFSGLCQEIDYDQIRIAPTSLSHTYGFLLGQDFSLNRIAKEYPVLRSEAQIAQSQFNLSFGKAIERLKYHLQTELGDRFTEIDKQLNVAIANQLASEVITKELAEQFIMQVKERSKGKMESPTIETLLTYQYFENPVKEFTDGFSYYYTTEDHAKAEQLEIQIELPYSWDGEEGERPHIVQKFKSQGGYGLELILLMIQAIPEFENIDKAQLDELMTFEELKDMIPDNGTYLDSKKVTLDNQPGFMLDYEVRGDRMDISLDMRIINFLTVYEGNLISLQCMVYGDTKEERLLKFNRYYRLFWQVANSLIIMDQYQ